MRRIRSYPAMTARVGVIACYLVSGILTVRAADLDDIVRRATAALKSDWAADPLYSYVEKDEVQKGDKVTSKTFEDIMIDGSDYHLPLGVNDERIPQVAYNAELNRMEREVERRSNETSLEREARINAWKKRHDEEGELLLDFPGILTFRVIGEEVKDGRPAYLLAATPRPRVVPTTRAAKVLTGVEGKVWVDKETLHPIRIECTVVRPVPVYGMLASVLPGTEIEIVMTQVEPSIWLIDLVSMKLKVSEIHLFKSVSTTRTTYSHYRLNRPALDDLLSEAARQ